MQKLISVFILGLLLHSHLTFANYGFCEKIAAQLPGFYDKPEFARARDLETLGDLAYEKGIQYFYLKVPVLSLPEILGARYLPEEGSSKTAVSTTLWPVSNALIGQSFEFVLGGLNIALKGMRIPPGGLEIAVNPNHNALVLYSPRILALGNWYFGNEFMLDRGISKEGIVKSLCNRARNCVSSSHDRTMIGELLGSVQSLQSERGDISFNALRFDGPLPSYEIVGIVVSPDNRIMVEAALARAKTDVDWKNRIIRSTTFPSINAVKKPYLLSQLRAVAEDINPHLIPDPLDKDVVQMPIPAMHYSDAFLDSVLKAFSSMLKVKGLLSKFDADEGFASFSGKQSQIFKTLASALSKERGGTFDGNKIPGFSAPAIFSRYGRFKVQAIREWKFSVVEFVQYNDESQKLIAVFIENDYGDGKIQSTIPTPHLLWGIGRPNADESDIEWIWTPTAKR